MPVTPEEPFDGHGRSPATQRFLEARRLMEDRAFSEAVDLLDQAATECPHFKTYELMGECYLRLERWTEAVPYLAAATTLNRGLRAPCLLAEAWLALGENREAVAAADIALSRDPRNKVALQLREAASVA